ncbi:MAG: NHL repeat-containing protein [Sedimentisphaerales bacterium]|nr:NHL repeat-containing protein [Sedimentisphaerales bacterium]
MTRKPGKIDPGILIGVVIAVAAIAGLSAIVLWDTTGQSGSGLSKDYNYDIEQYTKIDPALIRYEQVAQCNIGMVESRSIAIAPDNRIYIAGDKQIRIFSPIGEPAGVIASGQVNCLAIDTDGTIYAGLARNLAVFQNNGHRLADWPDFGDKAVLTSIALTSGGVFVADAGNRVILHYDKQGNKLGEIGRKDPGREIAGFVVPSSYMDVALAPDGNLRIANTGRLRIEAWSTAGEPLFWWGRHGNEIEAFCGCCNPAHFAILPNGNVITVEKGLIRVKEYDPDGNLIGVVAGPELLVDSGTGTKDLSRGFDVAVDMQNRIVVLDTIKNRIRIFSQKEKP